PNKVDQRSVHGGDTAGVVGGPQQLPIDPSGNEDEGEVAMREWRASGLSKLCGDELWLSGRFNNILIRAPGTVKRSSDNVFFFVERNSASSALIVEEPPSTIEDGEKCQATVLRFRTRIPGLQAVAIRVKSIVRKKVPEPVSTIGMMGGGEGGGKEKNTIGKDSNGGEEHGTSGEDNNAIPSTIPPLVVGSRTDSIPVLSSPPTPDIGHDTTDN
ncbi:unnamed protein product, partial [Choristocarpus tenellus]